MEEIKCPNKKCGATNRAQARFCDACGSALSVNRKQYEIGSVIMYAGIVVAVPSFLALTLANATEFVAPAIIGVLAMGVGGIWRWASWAVRARRGH